MVKYDAAAAISSALSTALDEAARRLGLRTLEEMQAEVTEVNRANGWYDDERTFGDDVALLHSEVSEALEAYRDHGYDDATLGAFCVCAEPTVTGPTNPCFKCGKYLRHQVKPEGVGSELADVLIRLLDTCERRGVDLRAEYERKIAYNRTRGHRHGGKIL